MKEKSALPKSFFTFKKALSNNINPFNIITLKRNIAFFPFTHKLCKAQGLEIIKLVQQAFKKCSSIEPLFYLSSKISALDKSLIFEHFMLEQTSESDLVDNLYVLDKKACFLAHINAQNHLHLHYLSDENNIKETFDAIYAIEHELAKSLTFSFNKKFGYLTSQTHDTGTALTCSSYLHLPALIHNKKIDEHKEKIHSEIQILGMNTENQYVADLVHIKNKCCLGILEKNILNQVDKTRNMLISMEEKERKNLKSNTSKDLKDKISRAFGLLSCAAQLNTQEALNALSLLELGKSLDWIEGLEKSNFSSLFFKTQRAHLPFFSKTMDGVQSNRAALLHQELKGAKLLLKQP